MATQQFHVASNSQPQDVTAFQQLELYPWDSDPAFQSGLQAILGSNSSKEQAEHLTLRARCFYFARYAQVLREYRWFGELKGFVSFSKSNIPIDFNAYQTWRSQQSSSPADGMSIVASGSDPSIVSNGPPRLDPTSRNTIDTTLGEIEPPAPYPTSFSQIVELITSGDPIPGIKEVPDTILQGRSSQPTTVERRKPWEKDDSGAGEEIVEANRTVKYAA